MTRAKPPAAPLCEERGFTLVELVVVLVIVAVLLSIVVSSLTSVRGQAEEAAAKSNILQIVPSIEAYFADNGSYDGMTLAGLEASYDQGLDATRYTLSAHASTYCVESTWGGQTWSKNGPTQPPENLSCP
jgi:prepilin-type N-terminal cleavage/methylation domain-containing protein